MKVDIETSWKKILNDYFKAENFKNLTDFINKEYRTKTIYPEQKNIFNAFNKTPFDKVSVIIVGQDPYHTPMIAEGLCFSVQKNLKIPPSIKNIYKEMESDLSIKKDFKNADLRYLTKQGVLLLNRVLTVEAHKAGSHWNKGWEEFTSKVIRLLSCEKENLIFILWGKNAQTVEHLIDNKKHLILRSAHPSPFSAYNGFFGNKHFSKTNNYLKKHNKKQINW